MNKKKAIKILALIFIIILGLILLRIYVFPQIGIGDTDVKVIDKEKFPYNEVTLDNIGNYLESLNIVGDLPNSAYIQLKIYKDEYGERIWEKSFIIKKNSVEIGEAKDPDMLFLLNSVCLDNLNNDFCGTIKKAKINKNIQVTSHLSKTSLYWKYMSVSRYDDCFGI